MLELPVKMPDTVISPPILPFTFTAHLSISSFAVPCETYLSNANNNKPGEIHHKFIATGALVFNNASISTPQSRRILLLQRAAHDSMPYQWEIPGGGCDAEDPSILHGVARELKEETGLTAVAIGPHIGDGESFFTRTGNLVRRFSFLVDVDVDVDVDCEGTLDVTLDPSEHRNYVWATEEEVRARRTGDLELNFTSRELVAVVLEAFSVRSEVDNDSSNI